MISVDTNVLARYPDRDAFASEAIVLVLSRHKVLLDADEREALRSSSVISNPGFLP